MMQLFENVTWFKSDADVIWFAAFWSSLAILGVLEVLIPAFQHPERLDRWPTNFSLGVINSILLPLAPVSAVWGADWAYTHGVGFLNQIAHPWWIAVAVTLAVRSLAGYLDHVLMHKVPLLWRLHRVHHLDTHLDISTSLRSHPAEYVINLLIIVPAAIVFGMPPSVLVIYELADTMVSVFSHANLRVPEGLDRWLRSILVTPNMHSLHHSSYQPETDSNYGTVFTFWDRLFGTYRYGPARSYDELQIGLTEIRDQRAWNLLWQLKSPALSIRSGSATPDSAVGL
jgi:sterol desaturase/sphingolipid hydroxylase (fatty acid hydroxylase superfamily)